MCAGLEAGLFRSHVPVQNEMVTIMALPKATEWYRKVEMLGMDEPAAGMQSLPAIHRVVE
jgi:hypothetical protein